ncbi:hypothetical protein G419_22189, partial [Rhodococcus triatomae BKS 15-14]
MPEAVIVSAVRSPIG